MNGAPHYLDYEIALLEVNHPYAYRLGEDVYLIGYDVTKGKLLTNKNMI